MPLLEKHWDVFFSYASSDREQVEKLALYLENEAGIKVFLDKWRLVPGEPFVPELREAIRDSRSCAVFIGTGGKRPWRHLEMQAALKKAVEGSGRSGKWHFRVFLVFLPGAKDLPKNALPEFLDLQTWVDFRSPQGLDDPEALERLVAGVRGVPPGRPRTPPSWLTMATIPGAGRPTGLAVVDGVAFVSDHAKGEVLRVESGAVVKRRDGLAKPHHLIVLDENLIVADTYHHRLTSFDLELEPCDEAPALDLNGLRRPHGLATNFPGEYYLTDADNHRVICIHHRRVVGTAGRAKCERGTGPGEFSIPCGIATSLDCVFVADTYNHRIQVLRRDLSFVSSFGEIGHGMAQMAYPVAVATWHHWIVVSDEHNKRLQLWRRQGQGLPFDTSCVSVDLLGDWLGSPFGICFDEHGTLFVADRLKSQLLRIDFSRLLASLQGSAA